MISANSSPVVSVQPPCPITYSVIIPIKNEEENIPQLFEEIHREMQNLNQPWELIYIDDGSSDGSPRILKNLQSLHPHVRVITFTKNFGQSSAFDAGFKAAKGEFVISMDGDGQNDPADIPKLVASIADCDLVCGWRVSRNDPWNKKIISKLSNFVRNITCKDGMHDTGCSLKMYRSDCLKRIKMYHGMHRFLPALFIIEHFRVKEIPVNHRERLKGKSNYHFFNRSLSPFLDMFAVLWMRKRHLHYQIKETSVKQTRVEQTRVLDKSSREIGTDRDAGFEISSERNSRRAISEEESSKDASEMRQFHRGSSKTRVEPED
jgi:dolichol-phosphate mannosyltransferase